MRNIIFAVAAGLAVANVYFAQPLLASMASELHVDRSTIGVVVTITQVGYALGLMFVVPLGDLVNRRRLVVTQMLISTLALIGVSAAPTMSVLLCAMVVIGLTAVVVQILVAFAAALSNTADRGRSVGTVTSGIVLGILLARFVAGALADLGGWRSVYLTSAALTLLTAGVLHRILPTSERAPVQATYVQLLRSVLMLFISEPLLRVRAALGFLIFAAFSALWTSLVLPLSAEPLALSHTEIGLFGLAGVAGALAASRAGRLADQGLGQRTTGSALVLLALSWVPMAFLEHSLWLLVVGVVLLDLAVQAVHVTNQSMIFAACPDSHSRLVGGYMLFYSIGSGVGAIASTAVYAAVGWQGVCVLGAGFSALGLSVWLATRRITATSTRAARVSLCRTSRGRWTCN